ncbi:MAG: hypothetical protein HKO95_09455 [Rhodobacteraceae bacterium]|nr:hypothetical protein [Alphaproteobacteria bacterium]MBT8474815.1 hypothetical protein [Alphaproteobacteria bacterium]NNK66951.1 hypothetical protein [Paracoccaceae bacterium]
MSSKTVRPVIWFVAAAVFCAGCGVYFDMARAFQATIASGVVPLSGDMQTLELGVALNFAAALIAAFCAVMSFFIGVFRWRRGSIWRGSH